MTTRLILAWIRPVLNQTKMRATKETPDHFLCFRASKKAPKLADKQQARQNKLILSWRMLIMSSKNLNVAMKVKSKVRTMIKTRSWGSRSRYSTVIELIQILENPVKIPESYSDKRTMDWRRRLAGVVAGWVTRTTKMDYDSRTFDWSHGQAVPRTVA